MADETKIIGLKITSDTGAGVNSMRQMEDAAGSLLGGMGRLDKGVGGFQSTVVGLAAAMGAVAFASYASAAVNAANQVDRATIGLAVTARYAGVAMNEANAAAKSLTEDGLMSVAEASKALQNLLSRGFSLPEAIQLMNGFKDSAAFGRQASLNFGEAIVGATEGLKNENSMLVDNAGVTKNVAVMWKEYAAQHGTTADKLTQSEKRHAELNGILKETEGQVGNAARMMDSFAGSQAKAAQQSFELKAAFGTGLQPVINATLDILGPVVSGLKDMVYWVETLGARAGATYDKLALRASIALSGKGMFSKEGLDEYEQRVKPIQQALDETIDDIVKRSLGNSLPDIGNDPGKRRTDTVIPPKGKTDAQERSEAAKLERENQKQLNEALDAGTDMLKLYYKELEELAAMKQEMAISDVELLRGQAPYLNYLGQMSKGQQDAFNITSMQSNWAGQNANSDRAAQQQGDSFSAALARQGGDGGEAEQLRRIKSEEEYWIQSWAMQTDSYAVFEDRKTQIAAMGDARRLDLKRRTASSELALSGQLLGSLAGLADAAFGLSQSKNKAHFRIYQQLKVGENEINTAGAITKALNDSDSSSWYERAAKAVLAGAIGTANTIKIMSASPDGNSGGASGNAFSAGGSYNPVVTQPTGAATQQQGNVTVQIMGNVIGEDRWVEENLVPALNQAGSRGVTIQYVN